MPGLLLIPTIHGLLLLRCFVGGSLFEVASLGKYWGLGISQGSIISGHDGSLCHHLRDHRVLDPQGTTGAAMNVSTMPLLPIQYSTDREYMISSSIGIGIGTSLY